MTTRTADTKYVRYHADGQVVYEQFFDLKNDPWEMKNERDNTKCEKVLDDMRARLARWEDETEAVPPCKPLSPNAT